MPVLCPDVFSLWICLVWACEEFVATHSQAPKANTHRWLLKVASRFAQISSARAPTPAWPNEDSQSTTRRLDDPVERKTGKEYSG